MSTTNNLLQNAGFRATLGGAIQAEWMVSLVPGEPRAHTTCCIMGAIDLAGVRYAGYDSGVLPCGD